MSASRNFFILIMAIVLGLISCEPNVAPATTKPANTARPTPVTPEPTDTPKPKFDPSRVTVLYQSPTAGIYTFNYDENNLEAVHLCLWGEGDGYTLLGQTGEDIRWFLNAVLLDNGEVVYTQYLNGIELAEIWAAGNNGENQRRLVGIDTFIELGKGFARAIPHQLVALPDQNRILFNTTELGYQAQNLNDLHLVDVDTGALTTLLAPGEGGELVPLFDQNLILILNPVQTLALDINTLTVNPTNLTAGPFGRRPGGRQNDLRRGDRDHHLRT